MEHFIKIYKKKTGHDIRSDNRAVQKLRREVEKAKRTLSSAHQARIEIESFYKGEDFSETLTRAKFEELNMVSINYLYVFLQTLILKLSIMCTKFLSLGNLNWFQISVSELIIISIIVTISSSDTIVLKINSG